MCQQKDERVLTLWINAACSKAEFRNQETRISEPCVFHDAFQSWVEEGATPG